MPPEPPPLTAASFDQWIDAARVLSALGRNSEALAAADKAMAIFPDNAHARWYRGQILYATQRDSEAEQEWQRALGSCTSRDYALGLARQFPGFRLVFARRTLSSTGAPTGGHSRPASRHPAVVRSVHQSTGHGKSGSPRSCLRTIVCGRAGVAGSSFPCTR